MLPLLDIVDCVLSSADVGGVSRLDELGRWLFDSPGLDPANVGLSSEWLFEYSANEWNWDTLLLLLKL